MRDVPNTGIAAGTPLPTLSLPATDGTVVDLSALTGTTVIYAYPRTSPPDEPPIEGWDQIPGARGCTPQSCAFRDHHQDLLLAGADRVYGLSTQDTTYQQEVVDRLHLPFALISDASLTLSHALGLELFEAGGMTLMRRVTLILRDGEVARVFDPVPDPAENAQEVLTWLRNPLA